MPFSKRQLSKILDSNLISAKQMPNLSMRVAETYLKKRMFAVEDTAVREQQRLYEAAYRDIRNQANGLAEQYGVTRAWRLELMRYVEQRYQRLQRDTSAVALHASAAAAAGSYYGRAWLLDVSTKGDVHPRMDRSFNPLQRVFAAQESITGVGYRDIVDSLQGRAWAEQFDWLTRDLNTQTAQAIITGMNEGEGVPDIMRRVRTKMGLNTDRRVKDIANRANFNKVQVTTRTVVNQVSNDAAMSLFQANRDVLSSVQWLTARDERVCALCRALDGTTYPVDTFDRPPRHPNCRCTMIPVINYDALVPAIQPPGMTFNEWLLGFGLDLLLTDFLSPRQLESERYDEFI